MDNNMSISTRLFLLMALFPLLNIGEVDAQITLNRDDLRLQSGDTVTERVIFQPGTGLPAEGANITWDYRFLPGRDSADLSQTTVRLDASAFTSINSDFYENQSSTLAGASIPVRLFYRADSGVYAQVGQQVTDEGAIEPGSGSLTIDTTVSPHQDGVQRLVDFPLTYQKQWSDTFRVSIGFSARILISDINGEAQGFVTSRNEVVGWGKLRLPAQGGDKDALLVRTVVQRVDSIFNDNGDPFGQQILDAAGLTQGIRTVDTTYRFFAKGAKEASLRLDVQEGTIAAATYEDFARPITGMAEADSAPPPLRIYPQPATKDVFLELANADAFDLQSLRLTSLSGQEQTIYSIPTARGLRLATSGLEAGLYFIQLQTHEGAVIRERFIIR